MTRDRLQRRLAITGAILLAGLFVAANAHLVAVAYKSQPACVPLATGHSPAATGC